MDLTVDSNADVVNYNRKLSLTTTSTIVSSLLIYRAKEILKKAGYTVIYNPFENYKSPSLTAAKTNADGSYIKITYQSKKQVTTKEDSKGIDIKILCLPSFTSVTRTDWKDDVKLIMKNSLKFDVPYFNMGVDESSIYFDSIENQLTLTAFEKA